MQRELVNTQVALTATFEVAGVATAPTPNTATVTIRTDDGTAIVTAAAATPGAAGVFTYTLAAGVNDQLDILTVEWTSALGTIRTAVQIVGGFLFTVAQARAIDPLQDTSAYPTSAVLAARTAVEDDLEHACGVAFVPRYSRASFSGHGSSTLILPPRTTAVRSVSLDGAAISAGALADLLVLPTGELHSPTGWTAGFSNYEIAFEHGWAYPPPAATEAALTWAKNKLVQGPIDDRTTAFTTDDGTFSMATPGMRGSVSGIPVVDSFIQQYDLRCAVA